MTLYYSQLFMHDTNASRDALNDDLDKIAECTFQQKMQFNPILNKQAQEIIFSRKTNQPKIRHKRVYI